MTRVGILFLGGAKRVSMARKFVEAGRHADMHVDIYSYEKELAVPIALVGEVIEGLRWSDDNIYEHLIQVCRERGIRMVIPFVDGAVRVAAELARRYPSEIWAPCGRPDTAELMFDKVAAAAAFEAAGLPVPQTWRGGEYDGTPLIAKPRHGSASKGILPVNTAERLQRVLERGNEYLLQRRFDRRREYTVDCYATVADGRVIAVVPRERNEVAGGEVVRTTVRHFAEAEQLACQAITRLGLRGAVTVQLIQDLDTGSLYIMEINPRLGGGAVAAVCAGADLPAMMLAEAHGMEPHADEWTDCLVARYLDETVFFFE